MNIHFIITGGTIDSYYEGTKDTAVPLKESIIPRYVNSLKLYNKTKFTQVCMKDSRNLTKTDLRKILKIIEKSNSKKIIITHGTYTMPDTARYLKANLKRKDQTIIFTAAMIPLEINLSDAGFNLGFSVSELSHLNSGIYLCMNGKIFIPEEITKIISEGRFTSVFTK
jgi:L-asparaginase